jgi:hypothetical protein
LLYLHLREFLFVFLPVGNLGGIQRRILARMSREAMSQRVHNTVHVGVVVALLYRTSAQLWKDRASETHDLVVVDEGDERVGLLQRRLAAVHDITEVTACILDLVREIGGLGGEVVA